MGVGRIKERNLALMDKWLWQFSLEGDTLWQSTISQKCGLHSNGWDCSHHFSGSWSILWKNICKLYPLFIPHSKFALGDCRSIKFWNDIWFGDTTLTSLYLRLFLISIQKEVVVADILSNSSYGPSWNLLFLRGLYNWEAQMVTYLLDSFHVDKRVWTLESSGKFSSKSFFIELSTSSNSDFSFSHRMIWKFVAPPRVKAFLWTICFLIEKNNMMAYCPLSNQHNGHASKKKTIHASIPPLVLSLS